MFDKLDALADRYAELSEAIAQPEVIRDFPRYQACLKERSGLEPVILKYQQFHRVEQQIADARELLSDPQMASEANAELSSLDTERENLLDELRLLNIPRCLLAIVLLAIAGLDAIPSIPQICGMVAAISCVLIFSRE